jgi:predicted glycoside hydrolase/deacetylase ChbG (UPF0249 family)
MRRLIINADDFGFTRGVNAGIVEACQGGVLRATTLMANGTAFEDAVDLARQTPGLDVGCHLVLVGGQSVAPPFEPLPQSMRELLWQLAGGLTASVVEREFSAQVEKILAAGLRPTHLDTHKHTHLAPAVLEAVLRVARRYGIPWIRRPFDLPLRAARGRAPLRRRLLNRALRPLRGRFDRRIAANGGRATDHFAGFQITGGYQAGHLAALIRALPEGITEFMCHPGHCDYELRTAGTRLTESRESELQALLSAEVRATLQETGVELTNFAEAVCAAGTVAAKGPGRAGSS